MMPEWSSDMRAQQHAVLDRIVPRDHALDYVAGNLDLPKHLMINCQREISKRSNTHFDFQESIAAQIMETGPSQSLSDDFFQNIAKRLPERAANVDHQDAVNPANDMLPPSLKRLMDSQNVSFEWKFLAPGMSFIPIWQGEGKQRIWMLKVKGGKNMLEHSHDGEEWALILDGSYEVANQHYTRGDLHVEDETCTHTPRIAPGRDCICLVYTEGPLRPTNMLARLLMPLIKLG